MKKLYVAIMAVATSTAFADTQVYRLERDTDSGCVSIVGQDGVSRPVVLISPEDYAEMTDRVVRVWTAMNKTEEGRRTLHGKRIETVIDSTNMVKTTCYSDGYIYAEEIPGRRSSAKVVRGERKIEPSKPSRISDRQWEMRKRIRDAQNGVPRIINVEHDAVTGKDTVK